MNVQVNPSTRTPLANAGEDQTVPDRTEVTLSGSASEELDAFKTSFSWRQVAGPTVQLQNRDTANPSFVAPDVSAANPALLTFRLSVDDGYGNSGTDDVNITVRDGNRLPNVDAGANRTSAERTTVALQSTASDPDGNQLTLRWTQVSGPAVLR